MNSKKIITNKRGSVKAQALQRSMLLVSICAFSISLFLLFHVFHPQLDLYAIIGREVF